ncbi:MAG: tetratricopeptide repeat protein [Gemmatimonadaceae bacterium]|nr:tetratricopeptide repeat protein [Gemmatimonadaceae bacterium]
MRSVRVLLFLFVGCVIAVPAGAQRMGEVAKRPKLPAGADSNDASAYLALGQRSIDESAETAAAAFYWAGRLDPSSPDALYGRRMALIMRQTALLKMYYEGGRRARENKDLRMLDSMYFRAIKIDPFLFERYGRSALLAYARQGAGLNFGSMSQTEINAWFSDEVNSMSPLARARMYAAQGRFEQAVLEYDISNEKLKSPYIRMEKATALAIQSLNKPALDELKVAIEELRKEDADKKEQVVFYNSKASVEHRIGILYDRLGQADSAKAAFGRAMAEDLAFFAAHIELGKMALKAKDNATAVSELGLAAELATDEPYVQFLYGSTLVATGAHADAIAPLKKAIELEPVYAAPHFALGQALEKTGDVAGAKSEYTMFLAMAPRRDQNRAIATQRLGALGGSE